MRVYINDSNFWKLINDVDRTKNRPRWFRTGSKAIECDIHLCYNEIECMKLNIKVIYTDDEDGRMFTFWIKSTGLVLGTRILKDEKAAERVIEYLDKESDRIFMDVTTWRRQ